MSTLETKQRLVATACVLRSLSCFPTMSLAFPGRRVSLETTDKGIPSFLSMPRTRESLKSAKTRLAREKQTRTERRLPVFEFLLSLPATTPPTSPHPSRGRGAKLCCEAWKGGREEIQKGRRLKRRTTNDSNNKKTDTIEFNK
jgi:hypothetical protein